MIFILIIEKEIISKEKNILCYLITQFLTPTTTAEVSICTEELLNQIFIMFVIVSKEQRIKFDTVGLFLCSKNSPLSIIHM